MPLTRIESLESRIAQFRRDHQRGNSIPTPEETWSNESGMLDLMVQLAGELVFAQSSMSIPSNDFRCNDGHQFHDALAGGVESVIFCAKCGEIRPLESPSRNHTPTVINNTVVQQ